jgi:hypothetical protein
MHQWLKRRACATFEAAMSIHKSDSVEKYLIINFNKYLLDLFLKPISKGWLGRETHPTQE